MYLISPLCFAAFTFLYILYRLRTTGEPTAFRTAALLTVIAFGVGVVFLTEVLSVFDQITRTSVFLGWIVLSIIPAVLWWRCSERLPPAMPALPRLKWYAWPAVAGLAGILGTTLFVALVAPPNTSDSLVYHMSRVMHWVQNQNVELYATRAKRQLYLYPAAEYAILHFQILSGADRFANLVQWGAGLSSMIGVSLITRLFISRPEPQLIAGLTCAAIPMGIMQSTSTQNDYVAACWLVCFVYFTLRLSTESRNWIWLSIAAGCSLGLGTLTKPNMVLFATPFMISVLLRLCAKRQVRILVLATLTIGLFSLALTAKEMWRVSEVWGNPTGPLGLRQDPNNPVVGRLSNDEYTFRVLASNLVRNASLHAGTPWKDVNNQIDETVRRIHQWLGMSVEDEVNTFNPGHTSFRTNPLLPHEDVAGNPLHLLLAIGAFGGTLLLFSRRPDLRPVLFYGVGLLGAALLDALIMRWQPWASRLELPLFVLSVPLSVAFFSLVWKGRILPVLVLLFITTPIFYVAKNQSRPLVGPRSILRTSREVTLFNAFASMRQDYTEAVRITKERGCRDVGLFLVGNMPEYAIWSLLYYSDGPTPTLRILGVTNETAGYAPVFDAPPCAVISNHNRGVPLEVQGQTFRPSWESQNIWVLTP